MSLRGYHTLSVTAAYGDWRLHDYSRENHHRINLQALSPLLGEVKELSPADVAWKGMHLPRKFTHDKCICCGGERYHSCNTEYPGIVIPGVNNPYGLPYRLIDGKHRMMKGLNLFYVIEYEVVKEFIV